MNIQIRTSSDKKDKLKLCPHVALQGVPDNSVFPQLEYTEILQISCTVCKKVHEAVIAIN